MSKPQISNVHVDNVTFYDEDRIIKAAAGFDMGDHRYHVWFRYRPETKQRAITPALYKNPKSISDPHYITRKLDPHAASNKKMMDAMWAEIERDNLIEKAIADKHREIEHAVRREAQVAAANRLRSSTTHAVVATLNGVSVTLLCDEEGAHQLIRFLPPEAAALASDIDTGNIDEYVMGRDLMGEHHGRNE